MDTTVTVEPSTGDDGEIPMPTSYSPDDLDGYPDEFYPIPGYVGGEKVTEHSDKYWKHNMGRTTYTVGFFWSIFSAILCFAIGAQIPPPPYF